ncbi:MAG: hypothetical protein ABIH35_03125 [Patescibacteria group bacterium]
MTTCDADTGKTEVTLPDGVTSVRDAIEKAIDRENVVGAIVCKLYSINNTCDIFAEGPEDFHEEFERSVQQEFGIQIGAQAFLGQEKSVLANFIYDETSKQVGAAAKQSE